MPVIKSFLPGEPLFSDVMPLMDLPKGSSEFSEGAIFLSSEQEPKVPYFLAGGLNPENVRGTLGVLSPFAVDVARGVETDGQKDLLKIQSFLNIISQ